MSIKQLLREALKDVEKKREYGCVMIFLDVDKEKWDHLKTLIKEEDLFLGDNDDKGFEKDPHATILYGLSKDVPDEDVEALIKEISNPKLTLKDVSSFKNEEFNVLKFDIKSKDLNELNKKFKKLLHTSKYSDYHPHATIAYLKKSADIDAYVEKFNEEVEIEVEPKKIVYSKPDGSKKNFKL